MADSVQRQEVNVRTRSGNYVKAKLFRGGEFPVYMDETGKFCVQVGERWERVTTLRAADKFVAKQKKPMTVVSIHGAKVEKHNIIEVRKRGYRTEFVDDAGRGHMYGEFMLVDDPEKLRETLSDIEDRRARTALLFAAERFAVLKKLVVVTSQNFDGLRDGTYKPTKEDRYDAHNAAPTIEDFE